MNGFLIIDKPKDWTSHDVCQKAKRLLQERRIGHTGTLDPLATGIMILCVGEMTKVVKYLTDHDKTYEATILFGVKTDTADVTGKILETQPVDSIDEASLIQTIQQLIGKHEMEVPMYSAIKVDGKKLYEFARKQQTITNIPKKEFEIYHSEVISPLQKENHQATISIRLHVSKGTYIRTIIEEIGRRIGVVATMKELRRTQVGRIKLDDSITIDQMNPAALSAIPLETLLQLPKMMIPSECIQAVENGAMLERNYFSSQEDTILVSSNNQPMAIYTYDSTKQKMRVSVKFHASPIFNESR